MKNFYKIDGEIVTIFITRKNGDEYTTTISLNDLPVLQSLKDCTVSVSPTKIQVRAMVSYRDANNRYVQELMHRFFLNAPKGVHVDHIDHNPLNNCRDNLRLVSNAQNIQNLIGARSDSKSGVRGINWRKDTQSWYVHCQINGKRHYLGRYKALTDAENVVRNFRAIHMPFSQDSRDIENPIEPIINHTAGKKNLSSGVKGITWNKLSKKWQIQVFKDGKKYHLGYYTELDQAKQTVEKTDELIRQRYSPTIQLH